MIFREKHGVVWLEFELLQGFDFLVHGVFLRKGGGSNPPFESLNIGRKVGDSPHHVASNREKIREILGLKTLVMGNLLHQDQIIEVENVEDVAVQGSSDGLFTKLTSLGLTVTHADCQAALFYDPKKEVIANIHCGWRGNVQNIFEKTVSVLKKDAGCDPKDLLVCISPSLGPSRAEFIHYREELPEEFYPYQVTPTYFDLWEISYQQLRVAGVVANHIEIAKMCTYEHKELFFSHRRDKITGRNATVIGLKERL